MKLINESTGKTAVIGETVTTFRGEKGILKGFDEPHKPSSSGKVYVDTGGQYWNQWFPSVIGYRFVE